MDQVKRALQRPACTEYSTALCISLTEFTYDSDIYRRSPTRSMACQRKPWDAERGLIFNWQYEWPVPRKGLFWLYFRAPCNLLDERWGLLSHTRSLYRKLIIKLYKLPKTHLSLDSYRISIWSYHNKRHFQNTVSTSVAIYTSFRAEARVAFAEDAF